MKKSGWQLSLLVAGLIVIGFGLDLKPLERLVDRGKTPLLATVLPGNPGVAVSAHYLVQVNTPMTLTLSADIAPSDNATFSLSAPPSHGTLSSLRPTAPQTALVLYTPESNFRGTDTFSFQVTTGSTVSAPAMVTLTILPAIIPWLEINLPDSPIFTVYPNAALATANMNLLDFGLAGLTDWAKVTDRVIITTSPSRVSSLYPELLNRKPPGLTIFGGLKTANALPIMGSSAGGSALYDFSSLSGWQTLASAAAQITSLTSNRVVVFDNESALGQFHTGNQPINYAALATSLTQTLKPLSDSGTVFWWWLPNYFDDTVAGNPLFNQGNETTQLINTIKSVLPNSVFLTQYTARYWWNNHDHDERSQMISLVGLPNMVEAIWTESDGIFGDSTSRIYTPAESIQELSGLLIRPGEAAQPYPVLSPITQFYPSAWEWISLGQTFSSVLPPLAAPAATYTLTPLFEAPALPPNPPPPPPTGPPPTEPSPSPNPPAPNPNPPPPPTVLLTTPNPPPVTGNPSVPNQHIFPRLIGPFSIGERDEQVRTLQQMLSTYFNFTPSVTLIYVNGVYDEVTVALVRRFQSVTGILNHGTPYSNGYGLAGPQTRAKLNGLFAKDQSMFEQLIAHLRLLLERLFEIIARR